LRRAAQRLAQESAGAEEFGGLEARHMTLLERHIAHGRTGATLTLPGGLRVTLGYETLSLTRGGAEATPFAATLAEDAEWILPVPGVVEIPALGWRVRAVLLTTAPGLEGAALPPMPRLAPLAHAGTASASHRGELRVYLDADRIDGPLTVRAWRPGDRFRPLGMAHEKKLQDVFVDAKAPRDLRRRLPIVCVGGRIAWVAGLRIADDFKLTQATARALALQAEPLTDELSEVLEESKK
jgi:tRNA(Ile)-lysidine synthase